MGLILAIDAGGTSSRAAVFDPAGACLGFGRAGAGNPTSAGIDGAVAGIGAAADASLRSVGPVLDDPSASAAIALAGEETAAFHDAVSRRLGPLGFSSVSVVPDLLGMFHSGTAALDGHVLIAGTGAIAGRVVDGELDRVAGGAGWLLGDAGSGFWIGHRVARAVVADLDGSAPRSVLTRMLLDDLGIEEDARLDRGASRTLRRLVSVLYGMRPVELARFAPLAFAATDDLIARSIVADASAALDALLGAVIDGDTDPAAVSSSPVVVGGSVLIEGMGAGRAPSLDADRPALLGRGPVSPVADGLLGAAVLAFRATGSSVDPALFDRLKTSLSAARRHDHG